MKEAQIILPIHDNHGKPLAHIHAELQVALCNTFSGYTAFQANGGWQSCDGRIEEPVTAYTVAMEPSEANDAVFREIALDVGRKARQEAVYIRYASGEVEIAATRNAIAA